jgi:hypothetical protein
MDELNLLEDLHRQIPGPSATEAARARARLLTAIDDLQSAAPRRPLTARRLAGPGWLARPRVWLPVGAAAAVTAVITAVSVLAPAVAPGRQTGGPGSAHRPTAAALALNEAASAAARQFPGHGQFFVSEAEIISPIRPSVQPYVSTARWSRSAVWWNGDGDAMTGIPHGQNPVFPPWPITLGQAQQLPSDPVRLLADLAGITHHISGPTRYLQFWAVSIILAYYPVSPALRAALYRAAAMLPGLRLVSRARDPLGRVGAEVYGPSGTAGGLLSSEVIFFDPATGALLDYEVYRLEKASSKPQCSPSSEQIALLASGYVGLMTQLPPGAPLTPRPVDELAPHDCPPVGGPQPTAPARSRS